MTSTSLTIDSALLQARLVWFRAGLEGLREDGIRWLETPDATIPAIFTRIAKDLRISIRSAITTGRLIEDQATAGLLDLSKEFQAMPLAVLDLFFKARNLYISRLTNANSSGAADKKVMYGQWRGDKYKSGLITKLGDYFVAHMAYYMAIGGWAAVREVRRATGWSLSRLEELLLIAIREINWIKKKIGLRMLNALSKTVDRGMHFFSSVFAVLSVKLKAKDIQVAVHGESEEEVTDDETSDSEEEATDVTLMDMPTPDPDDENDPQDPPDRPYKDVFDDPNQINSCDIEPHAKLKTGRELAFNMLNNARKAAGGKPRHQQLMDAIDDQKLVNALQKDSKNHYEVGERMTSFLSYCWQWAECTGIFSEKEYRHLVDAQPESVIKQITKAVQRGYWESGDNKPQDVPKIWKDVMHKDDLRREKLARLTRPCSQGIKTKPHIVNGLWDGRTVILNPGPELRAYFFQHLKKAPANESLRYLIINHGTTETITCQQYIHPRKSLVDNNTMPLNNELEGPDGTGCKMDALDLDDKTMAMVVQMLGISPDLMTAARFGDERALAVVLKAAKSMDEGQRDALMDALASQ
ncbi:hypothetical protein NR402_09665 [Acidithiobacillus ferrooxidans]|uniref:hypothetical protein n=1 Tax=Acidithiobacillus ferrooxidans TaxID=920 RepID=UPI00214CC5E8|nr:hypothetical protein [Acidithiobacillus ferrooxidans]MCR2830544.1 hypothetical protein [Acidithiobacillus ferrooxidans]